MYGASPALYLVSFASSLFRAFAVLFFSACFAPVESPRFAPSLSPAFDCIPRAESCTRESGPLTARSRGCGDSRGGAEEEETDERDVRCASNNAVGRPTIRKERGHHWFPAGLRGRPGPRHPDPSHPTPQGLIGLRPNDEMPVIGHDAVGQQLDRIALQAFRQHALERFVVRRLAKQPHPPVPPIENVVDHPGFRGSSSSRHDGRISLLARPVNISDVPFSIPPFPFLRRQIERH
jgi:hypothetical protein